jgi:hypothetical protein
MPEVESEWLQSPEKRPVLRIALHGSYASGSAGKADKRSLQSLVTQKVQAFRSENKIDGETRAVLDLTDYAYSWGDDLVDVIDFFGLTRKYALVVGPYCRRGISTLMKMNAETKYDCIEDEGIFLFLDEAVEYIRRL